MKIKKEGKIIVSKYASGRVENLSKLKKIFENNIDNLGDRWATHLGLFLGSSELARILWLNEIYKKNLEIPGNVIEFGSQYGASFNLFNMLRIIYEPWNVGRSLYSFTTFEDGFVDVDEKDGEMVDLGDYAVTKNWKKILESILKINSKPSPVGDLYNLIEGDVSKTFPQFLLKNPHVIFSLVHFDLDVYAPTKNVLKLIIKKMPKGAILVFDELNHPAFPGETLAVNEVLGISNLKLRKSQFQPYSCYCIIE